MLKRVLLSLALPVVLSGTATAWQQRTDVEFAERFERMYAQRPPLPGAVIGQIKGLDEDGKPFDMARVKGKYAVYVFGCLT